MEFLKIADVGGNVFFEMGLLSAKIRLCEENKQLPVLIQSLWLTQCHSVRLVSYLKRAKIVTAISRQTT